MEYKIIVCGGNGAGKSTLGKQLARELGWKFKDIEDYYFPISDSDNKYAKARTEEEVRMLLLEDLSKKENIILASVRGNYSAEIESLFTHAVLISVPKDIRLKRVRDRAYQQFGERMLPDGDLYEQQERFFDMVNRRSEETVQDWLDTLDIPIMRVDGTQAIEDNVKNIIQMLVGNK